MGKVGQVELNKVEHEVRGKYKNDFYFLFCNLNFQKVKIKIRKIKFSCCGQSFSISLCLSVCASLSLSPPILSLPRVLGYWLLSCPHAHKINTAWLNNIFALSVKRAFIWVPYSVVMYMLSMYQVLSLTSSRREERKKWRKERKK